VILVVLLILSLVFGGFRKGKIHTGAGHPVTLSANARVIPARI